MLSCRLGTFTVQAVTDIKIKPATHDLNSSKVEASSYTCTQRNSGALQVVKAMMCQQHSLLTLIESELSCEHAVTDLGDLHLHLLLGGTVPVAHYCQNTPQLFIAFFNPAAAECKLANCP